MSSLINYSLLELFEDRLDTSYDKPIVCCKVEKVDKKKHKSKKVFIMLESSMAFFKNKKQSKKSKKPNKKISYYSIKMIRLIPKKSLEFQLDDDKFSLHGCDVDEIAKAIKCHLYCFMRKNELPDFEYPDNSEPKVQLNPGIRFLTKKYNDETKFSKEDIDLLKRYFKDSPKAFVLSKFKSLLPHLELLVNCASLLNTCTILVIDVVTTDAIASSLSNIIRTNNVITEIQFLSPIRGNTKAMAASFSREPPSPIKTLMFGNFKMDETTIQSLIDILTEQTLKSLQIEQCLTDKMTTKFLEKLQGINRVKEIQYLDLSYSDKMDITLLFNMIPKVRHLKLSHCDLEVTSILESLSKCNVNKIETLDISFNLGKTQFNDGFNYLPASLIKINLENVDWKFEVFSNVFKRLMEHEPAGSSYTVMFSNVNFHAGVWNTFFNSLKNYSNQCLTKFSWIGNPIEPSMLHWLNNLPSINSVIFDGCIGDNNKILPNFINFIEKSIKIKSLSLNAVDGYEISEKNIRKILTALKRNYSYDSFSILGQHIEDIDIKEFADILLENRRITKLEYDFIDVKNYQTLLFFFQTLAGRGVKLQIDWPENVISEFVQKGEINDNDIKELKKAYDVVIVGDRSIDPPLRTTVFVDEDGNIPLGEAKSRPVSKDELNYSANRPINNLPPPPPTNIQANLPPQPRYIYVDSSHRDDTRKRGQYMANDNDLSGLSPELRAQLYPELSKKQSNNPIQSSYAHRSLGQNIPPPPANVPPPPSHIPPSPTNVPPPPSHIPPPPTNVPSPPSHIQSRDLPTPPNVNLPPPPSFAKNDLPPPPSVNLPPPPSQDLPTPPNVNLPPPPSFSKNDLSPPPTSFAKNDLPPPPPSFAKNDLPPPPTSFVKNDLPPPPPSFAKNDLPPPPPSFAKNDLPPTPPSFENSDLPPPPPSLAKNDLPPPPPSFAKNDLPPPPPSFAKNDLPPPPPSFAKNDLPPPPTSFAKNDLPPPPTSFAKNDLPPPPPSFAKNDLPPPPTSFAKNDLPPPPTSFAKNDLPPPPPSFAKNDLPTPPNVNLPPPPSFSKNDLSPPPTSFAKNDLPPPPPSFAKNDLPPPPTSFAKNDLPPPPTSFAKNDLPPPPSSFAKNNIPPNPPSFINDDLPAPPTSFAKNDFPPPPSFNQSNLPPPPQMKQNPPPPPSFNQSNLPPPPQMKQNPPPPPSFNQNTILSQPKLRTNQNNSNFTNKELQSNRLSIKDLPPPPALSKSHPHNQKSNEQTSFGNLIPPSEPTPSPPPKSQPTLQPQPQLPLMAQFGFGMLGFH